MWSQKAPKEQKIIKKQKTPSKYLKKMSPSIMTTTFKNKSDRLSKDYYKKQRSFQI